MQIILLPKNYYRPLPESVTVPCAFQFFFVQKVSFSDLFIYSYIFTKTLRTISLIYLKSQKLTGELFVMHTTFLISFFCLGILLSLFTMATKFWPTFTHFSCIFKYCYAFPCYLTLVCPFPNLFVTMINHFFNLLQLCNSRWAAKLKFKKTSWCKKVSFRIYHREDPEQLLGWCKDAQSPILACQWLGWGR